MCVQRAMPFMVGVLMAATPLLAGSQPLTVSPGEASQLVRIGDPCPTFSWGQADGASGYELVVYRLGEEGEEAQRVLRQRISGSASGWTPSLDRCLEEGGRYAWSVRAIGGRQAPEWSAPRLFQVAAGPSQVEFEQALTVVREYLAIQGSPVAPTATEALAGDERAANLETPARLGSPSDLSPPATISLVTEGAVGIGTSTPLEDLHIHSNDPPPTGLDRVGLLLTPSEPFWGTSEIVLAEDSNGAFGMKLRYNGFNNHFGILGYDSAGDTDPFLEIDRVTGELTLSALTCAGCVGPGEIASEAVDTDEIAFGAVTSGKIASDSIRDHHLDVSEKGGGTSYSVGANSCATKTECCGLVAQNESVLSGGPFEVTPDDEAILVASAKGEVPPGPPNYSDSCWTVTMCSRGAAFTFKIWLLCIG